MSVGKRVSKKKVMVWAWVSQEVRWLVEKIAESQGISISEYVRRLIVKDLDRRNVFTSKLRGKVKAVE